jgi:hypothetical protein
MVTIYTLNGRLLKTKSFDKLPFENHRIKTGCDIRAAGLYVMYVERKGVSPLRRIIYLEN